MSRHYGTILEPEIDDDFNDDEPELEQDELIENFYNNLGLTDE